MDLRYKLSMLYVTPPLSEQVVCETSIVFCGTCTVWRWDKYWQRATSRLSYPGC